jgi:hypothetical protein
MMPYGFLADLIVALHVLYVSFVVLGQAAILAGVTFGWRWVRNFWFRVVHLCMIAIVAAEAILGITCPLTRWEYDLRRLAGQRAGEGSFIGRLLHNAIFFDAPPWVFTTVYVAFALAVVWTLWLVPPQKPAWRTKTK